MPKQSTRLRARAERELEWVLSRDGKSGKVAIERQANLEDKVQTANATMCPSRDHSSQPCADDGDLREQQLGATDAVLQKYGCGVRTAGGSTRCCCRSPCARCRWRRWPGASRGRPARRWRSPWGIRRWRRRCLLIVSAGEGGGVGNEKR